jgi:aquaporin Z
MGESPRSTGAEGRSSARKSLVDYDAERLVRTFEDFADPSQEWRRLSSELLGTFFLVLVLVAACGAMMSQAFPNTISRSAAVVAPGLMVLAIILFMGKVSGAHLNPAVSIAFALRGDFPWRRVPGYVVVQLAGAALAAWFLKVVVHVSATYGSSYPASGYSAWDVFLMETVLTLGLVSVILGTASGAQNLGIVGAFGVGAYIALAGLWGSPISGAAQGALYTEVQKIQRSRNRTMPEPCRARRPGAVRPARCCLGRPPAARAGPVRRGLARRGLPRCRLG